MTSTPQPSTIEDGFGVDDVDVTLLVRQHRRWHDTAPGVKTPVPLGDAFVLLDAGDELDPANLTPSEARAVAIALLRAADKAEELNR